MKMIQMKLGVGVTITLLTVIVQSPNAAAQGAILDNTGSVQNDNTYVQSIDQDGNLLQNFVAQSFTTGDNYYNLDSLSPIILSSGGNGFQIAVYSDNNNAVGDQIAMFAGPGSPELGSQTYTPSSTVTLNPLSTYWLVATATGGGNQQFLVAETTDPSYVTTDGWRVNGVSYGGNSGWGPLGSGENLQFTAGATILPVPEPSTMTLTAMGGGLAAVLAYRRRGKT